MENRTAGKDIRMKDAEKLMGYLRSLPEEQRGDVVMASYYFAQGVVAAGMKEGGVRVG